MATITSSRPSPHFPPSDVSGEADHDMLRMAREQGDALKRAAEYMMQEEAQNGAEAHAGDLLVSYAVEEAEGLHHWANGKLEWREPGRENVHIEIGARDAADGRFVPGLEVRVTVVGPDGKEVGTHPHAFLWHPWLYHYGRNWEVPGEGAYTLRVHIEPPTYARHDRKNGIRFREPVDVEFGGVQIKPGRKES